MKSQIRCRTENSTEKGSLLFEVLLAISMLSIFLVASMTLVYGARNTRPLLQDRAKDVSSMASGLSKLHDMKIDVDSLDPNMFSQNWFSDSLKKVRGPGSLATAVFGTSFENEIHDSCDDYFGDEFNIDDMVLFKYQTFLPADVPATHISARNGYIYMTTDSSVQTRHDLYIYDANSSTTVSSIHTGPGLASLAISGHLIYVANTSTTNQLQVIDILNMTSPYVYARFRLPLPEASTTPPHGSAIFYSDSRIYLGTDKWDGSEFSVIDVSNPSTPVFLGGFEIGSIVKDIIVSGKYAYISTAGQKQFMKLDVSDPGAIFEVGSLSPAGWQIEEGSVIDIHRDEVWMSALGGGFNTGAYKEIFRMNSDFTATSSVHVPGGVYGLAIQEPYAFLATGRDGGSFEILNISDGLGFNESVAPIPLDFRPVSMACDRDVFYIATEDGGIIRINFKI